MISEILRESDAEFFVMYGTGRDANFFYATRFRTYDPTLYLIGIDGTELLVVPEMEKGRAERESRVKEIASFEDLGFREKVKKVKDTKKVLLEILISILKEGRCRKVLVPDEMPSFISIGLMRHFNVEIVKNPFSKLRVVKKHDEIKKIKDVSNAIVSTFKWLIDNFNFKKCEEVRRAIELSLYSSGYLAKNTICSSGKLSADPHELGRGNIEDHILVDVFPRSMDHGYYSDFTRTIFINKNDELEGMYSAVVSAQNEALGMIRDGADAEEIHRTVKEILNDHGYKTNKGEGFIHSTGHGIGLDVHEDPRIGDQSVVLRRGMVVTVEPGLYYKKIGGVRVEDTVVVKKNGCEVLTQFPKFINLY